MPIVGIVCDVIKNGLHNFHGVGEKYINAVAHGAKVMPVLIPAQGPGEDLIPIDEKKIVNSLIGKLDGLFLSGSPSNVDPKLYGNEQSLTPESHDTQRDDMTMLLINAALEKRIPILGVCRGMQEINVALGGSLHQKVHNIPEMMDHRENKSLDKQTQYSDSHKVKLVDKGKLSKLLQSDSIQVNSLHGQGIDRLADGLVPEAHASDGLVEAFSSNDAEQFLLAVQWHPEWKFEQNPFSKAIFKAFGDAINARS